MEGAFATKCTNIEIENNFARIQSMQAPNRGRTDHVYNTSAKHYLAEMKTLHTKSINLPAAQWVDAQDSCEQANAATEDSCVSSNLDLT